MGRGGHNLRGIAVWATARGLTHKNSKFKRGITPKSNLGGFNMTKQEIETLNLMRSHDKSAADIAIAFGLSVNTVRSYIRRHPPEDAVRLECRQCGKPILQVKVRRPPALYNKKSVSKKGSTNSMPKLISSSNPSHQHPDLAR